MTPVEQLVMWRTDMVQAVRDLFNVEPDKWQALALEAFPGVQRLSMKACKGPGKTCLLAWILWIFLLTRPHANCVAVSITSDNLRDGLWKELAKWQLNSPLLKDQFKVTKTRIFQKDHPDTWWLSARSFPKQGDAMQQADALAGLHAEYILFVLDEAGGIPDAVMATAEAGLSTGTECKIVIAGNPTHNEGPLYRSCTSEAHLWHVVEITGDPDDPHRSPRISEQWAREQIDKYGKDNPWVKVNVFGQFPPASLNALIGPEEVREAQERQPAPADYEYAQKRLGVDVARFGDDRTCIFRRQGMRTWEPIMLRNMRSYDVAARVIAEAADFGCDQIFVDDTGGYGSGVIDSMIQAGWSPIPINFSGKAIDPRYYNKRAEMYFLMAEWVKARGQLCNMPDLVRELTASTYSFHNGKFQIENKALIKGRLGYSPDIADALALTFALPEMPGMQLPRYGLGDVSKNVMKHEWNPYSDESMNK